MTRAKKIRAIVLLAWAAGSVSCGLIRLPFRVAGHVTRGTIHAGETAYKKSKEGVARRKQKREARKEDGSKDAPGDKKESNAAKPHNGGLLPDLPPPPEAELPAPDSDADGGFSEPPLPGLPE